MIDSLIVSISSISFFLFVAGLILVVRVKGQAEILTSMKQLYLLLAVVGGISLWFMAGDRNIVDMLLFTVLYLILFWAMAFSYILGLFGIPLSSVRMQLLMTLVAHGRGGADMKKLRKEYSTKALIGIRLHRLGTSGEIIKKGKQYMLRSRWSYFVLHNVFLLFLIKLFRPIRT